MGVGCFILFVLILAARDDKKRGEEISCELINIASKIVNFRENVVGLSLIKKTFI